MVIGWGWVNYVEEPLKYQTLRPHFSLWVGGVGGGVGGVLVRSGVSGGVNGGGEGVVVFVD